MTDRAKSAQKMIRQTGRWRERERERERERSVFELYFIFLFFLKFLREAL